MFWFWPPRTKRIAKLKLSSYRRDVWTFRNRWYVRAHALERGLRKPVGLPGTSPDLVGPPTLHLDRLQDPFSVSVESLYNGILTLLYWNVIWLFVIRAPITTATSVIAVKFDSGVMMAADILGSYGSLARFRNCPRLVKLNDNIIIGASGDYADFQYLRDIMERKMYGWNMYFIFIRNTCIDASIKQSFVIA